MLPEIKKVPLQKLSFPQTWQTVVFRNYGLIAPNRLAKTLGMDETTLEIEAQRMGLDGVKYDARWESKGFITIIRNNWFLLPYKQLKTLLDYDDERLEFVLQKEDFLSVKLGDMKPECMEVFYAPLTEKEINQTEELAKKVRSYLPKNPPEFNFNFDKKDAKPLPMELRGDNIRLIHGYLTPCGDAFMQDSEDYLPDGLLQEYQKQGINGVWVHGVLSALSPYPFKPELSTDYKLRREKLKVLVERAKKYGIKVYLYFNEPRGIPVEQLGEYAHLKGTVIDGVATLCMEQEEVQTYLYDALKDLYADVQDLGGAITITMSESPTHCQCRSEANCTCPVCKNIPVEKTVAKVNNIFAKALRDAKGGAKTLAYIWGWSKFMDFTEEQTKRAISYLDKDVVVVCASEYGVQFNKGGIASEVVDYSISNPGPSPIAKISFEAARKNGAVACAKIQTNNSWECSAVPYLPVYDLVLEHLQNLNEAHVNDYMLTWTLGGYPSPMLDLVAEYASNPQAFDLDKWYEKHYGVNGKKVHEAALLFCEGFKAYPFNINGLYFSPKTLGPANLWSLTPEEKQSTMVCYAFDDYEYWINPYPYEVYVSQFEKLLTAWKKGMQTLQDVDDECLQEFKACAEGAYIHFKADSLQTQFSYLKKDLKGNKAQLLSILQEEEEITKRLLCIMEGMPAIGIEASNHYLYNTRNLIEKILQTQRLQEELKQM